MCNVHRPISFNNLISTVQATGKSGCFITTSMSSFHSTVVWVQLQLSIQLLQNIFKGKKLQVQVTFRLKREVNNSTLGNNVEDICLKGTVVNRVFNSVNGGSFNITSTVPLKSLLHYLSITSVTVQSKDQLEWVASTQRCVYS